MGYNTVAVLLNDCTDEIGKSGHVGARIKNAMRSWYYRDRDRHALNFGCGTVISMDHADGEQVVIVARNSGVRADEATELGWYALEQMKGCLERHGYTVRKKRKPKIAGDAHD